MRQSPHYLRAKKLFIWAAAICAVILAIVIFIIPKAQPLPTLSDAAAMQQIRDSAKMFGATIGVTTVDSEKVVTAPCYPQKDAAETDQTKRIASGIYHIPLSTANPGTTLQKLHDTWKQQGWEIEQFEMFTATEGILTATNPADKIKIRAVTAKPSPALAVTISGACYKSSN